MGLSQRDQDVHTYGEYLTWPENQRYEIIDGTAYAMSPAPSRTHQRMVLELSRQIGDALDDHPCEVNIAPFDVRLARQDEPDEAVETVVQPDIVVVCDERKLDQLGCRGGPDWIIEVLSPATASHDQVKKVALYERHGVREYWLVHPTDLVLTIYRLQDGVYGRPEVCELQEYTASSTCPDAVIDWERALNNLPG
jgi:Uma2 family endonuclease